MKRNGSGWHGESRRHSLARKGIISMPIRSNGLEKPHTSSRIDNIIFRIRMYLLKNPIELTEGYCVEFARAMRDFLGGGENYRIGGHNVLFYEGMFIDGKGIHTKEELEEKYGNVLFPDPDGWAYIYNSKKLKEYAELLEQANKDRIKEIEKWMEMNK